MRDANTVLIANPGADLYGSDRMAIETVRALVAAGHRVVVTVPNRGPLIRLLQAAGAEVIGCPTPIVRKGLLSVRGLASLLLETANAIAPSLRLLRMTNAGTVIVNTITPPLWLILARLTGRRTICHVHEGEKSISSLLRRALYLPLTFANALIINSRFSLDVLATAAPWLQGRTSVVYNTVAGPEQVVPPREHLDGGCRLLYVGRLSQRKGPHVAITALRLLRDAGSDARLSLLGAVFPGNEEYAKNLRQLVRDLGLEDHVTFLGFKPSVWSDLADHDIVLIPSTVDEPFGNTAVEAALAARPAVISRIGGLPEASAHSSGSVLVEPDDVSALAGAVRGIVDNWPEYRQRAMADADSVAAAFSSDAYAAGIRMTVEATGQLRPQS